MTFLQGWGALLHHGMLVAGTSHGLGKPESEKAHYIYSGKHESSGTVSPEHTAMGQGNLESSMLLLKLDSLDDRHPRQHSLSVVVF